MKSVNKDPIGIPNPLGVKDNDYIYINILLDDEWKTNPERHLKYIFNNHIEKELSEVREMYNNFMGKNIIKSLITENEKIIIQNNNIKYIKEFDTLSYDPSHDLNAPKYQLETEDEQQIRENIKRQLVDCIYANIRWERDKVSRLLSWKSWLLYKSNLLR